MRHISLKRVPVGIFATVLLLMGSLSASAQYYMNVYEKGGSNSKYAISNLDSVSIVKYDVANVSRLTINNSRLNLETGETAQFSVRGFASNGTEIPLTGVTWKSSNTAVATVDAKGAVRTYKSGNATITASIGSISVTCSLTVADHTYTLADLSRITINKSSANIETGDSTKLTARGYASNGTEITLKNVLWRSSNPAVATIDENGMVKTHKSGYATISVSFGMISNSCYLTVVDHTYTTADVVKIGIDKKDVNVITGDSVALNVKGFAKNGVEIPLSGVAWKSDKTDIATVDASGFVRTYKQGTAHIIASVGQFKDTCVATVRNKLVAMDVLIDSLAESGIYLGVICFNEKVDIIPIKYLNTEYKAMADSFIDVIPMAEGTALYYAVDKAIEAFGLDSLPGDISKVAIVTFTDGINLSSNALLITEKGWKYDTEKDYGNAIMKKIATYSIEESQITSYSIGLKGKDIRTKEDSLDFVETIHNLASVDSLAFVVSDMSEVNKRFKQIAKELNQIDYLYSVPVKIQARDDGTKVRYTFDGVNDADASTMYIEGILNYYDSILVDVHYHGLTSSSGSVVRGATIPGSSAFQLFTFENVKTESGKPIDWNFTGEYYVVNNRWRTNEEFRSKQTELIDKKKSSAVIMLVLDYSSSLGKDDYETLQEKSKEFVGTLYSANDTTIANNDGGNNNSIYSKTPIDLSLAVSINGTRYYLTKEEYRRADLSKAVIEGLTVVFGGQSFIMALQDEPISSLPQSYAISYYDNLPSKAQGEVISARWTYINNALKTFGGTPLSTYFWTKYYTSSSSYTYRYYVYSGGGQLSNTNSNSTAYPVRLVYSTDASTPITWRDANDLSLVAYKNNEAYYFTKQKWDDVANKSEYDVKGVLVTAGKKNKFVIALQNEQTDNIVQSSAISYYGSNLPTTAQGYIIGYRWNSINNALKDFGGTSLSSNFWTNYTTSNSSYTYRYFQHLTARIRSDLFIHILNIGWNLLRILSPFLWEIRTY